MVVYGRVYMCIYFISIIPREIFEDLKIFHSCILSLVCVVGRSTWRRDCHVVSPRGILPSTEYADDR